MGSLRRDTPRCLSGRTLTRPAVEHVYCSLNLVDAAFRYRSAAPRELEAIVAGDLRAALGRREATVARDGAARRPDIIVDAGRFAIVVEVTKRSGADAAGEYLAIRDHRETVEREREKPVHLLFSCIRTPARIIRAMREENAARDRARRAGRMLFLNLESLEAVLGRLAEASADLYPVGRWDDFFNAWPEIADDVVAFQHAQRIVLPEDTEFSDRLRPMLHQRVLAEQERLRRDVRKLEDALRQSNITGSEAMRALVYVMFIKLYEERREEHGEPNRLTPDGFVEYRERLSNQDKHDYAGRTLHHLLDKEIAADEQIQDTGILAGASLPDRLSDGLVEDRLLPVLDRYQFWRTHLDALGSVFEAIARRAEKDTRIGQFFTPEPIVRFAVDVVQPGPTEVVLDPAAGTGRFLAFSLEHMVSGANTVPGIPWPRVREAIEEERLLGTDVDAWIVTIAKMTMYMHGDGKSNIFQENGLFLADIPVFARFGGQSPAPTVTGQIDVCLTNPPLGAMSYRAYAEDLVRRHRELGLSASEWLRDRLPILPGHFREERQIQEAESRIATAANDEREAIRAGDTRREARAAQRRRTAEACRTEARARLIAGAGTYEIRGSTAKGGALFLAAIKDYLKTDRDPSAPEEWRGGRLGIVVDEAILNTPEYAQTRRFIRRHYFIKAVFSFHRDAFWYQARTTAKTSLLYLVRKRDTAVRQREPVFFGHVDHVGFTRTGKPDPAEQLPELLHAYLAFEKTVRACYRGASFDEPAARREVDTLGLPGFVRIQWQGGRPPADDAARLDYAAEAARHVRDRLPSTLATLGDYAEVVLRAPEEDPSGIYQFATIDRTWGDVKPSRLDRTEYPPGDLRLIRPGDIVISGIDLVNGAVGYADVEVADHVVSKEFYTLLVRPERAPEVDARYLALLLRTPRARELIAGTVTGTSNRTRVEDIGSLLAIPLPHLPPLKQQRELAGQVERALARRRRARATLTRALTCADAAWEAPGDAVIPARRASR